MKKNVMSTPLVFFNRQWDTAFFGVAPMKQVGLFLILVGIAIAINAPLSAFKGFAKLLAENKLARSEGRDPTFEQKVAYHSFVVYVISAILISIGVLIFLIGLTKGE